MERNIHIRPAAVFAATLSLLFAAGLSSFAVENPPESGLLFRLSGDYGFTADNAAGSPDPMFIDQVSMIPDGFRGPGFRVPDFMQVMAYSAPRNIYAQRGTLSFFWRAREPLGKTPFHIFQVSYYDHSSIDMVFIRIDWNGEGFEAFATDVNLARVRVSYRVQAYPKPDDWTHIAFAWDEARGVRLYVNGALAASRDTTSVFDSGLDMFGPHNRFINPQHIWANCGHVRGGDLDELRIYDCMLPPESIALLAKGEGSGSVPALTRSLEDPTVRGVWLARFGWDRSEGIPPHLEAPSTAVRKVETLEVYDLKQKVWKGCDGIPETTWPFVYNQSRLPGRLDYFIEPDWNCYSLSGKTVTFSLPDEEWNRVDIDGAAYGTCLTGGSESIIITRSKGIQRTENMLPSMQRGGLLRFENDVIENPIRELSIFRVVPGKEPAGLSILSYTVSPEVEPDNPCLHDLIGYIEDRHPEGERSIAVALPGGAPRNPRKIAVENALPIVHILIPCDFRIPVPFSAISTYSYSWENIRGGLDGIAIDLPSLSVNPTNGNLIPLNITLRDPIWPNRRLIDFSFSVKTGEARTLWLDTRDRILPNDAPLYLTVACAEGRFGLKSLDGMGIRLVFKDRETARAEHEADRYQQVVDNYSNIVECGPNTKKLHMFDRFLRDLADLLRVNPDHPGGRLYQYEKYPEQGRPPFVQPAPPSEMPLWAFRQVEDLKLVKQFVDWWIDERQIANGEFGGGLSDDGDMTNQWPGLALMGIEPEKIADSLRRLMDAYYSVSLFTNGLSTIQADELHCYEEGIDVLPQVMLLDYGDPKQVERIMATSKALEHITGVNTAGHRHIRSSYFSGTVMAEEGVWAWSHPYSYLIFHPAMSLVDFNGNPKTRKLILELLDGLLAHRKKNPGGSFSMTGTINFLTDAERPSGIGNAIDYFWEAWRWTGDRKYLDPVLDQGPWAAASLNANLIDFLGKRDSWGKTITTGATPASGGDFSRHLAWQMTGDTSFLSGLYGDQIRNLTWRMPLMTDHHWWVDRVGAPAQELQRARLGGVALWRNVLAPGHLVSWRFSLPATGESAAILIPDGKPDGMTVIVYNLESRPVEAVMTGWNVDPGVWEVTTGIDGNGDNRADDAVSHRTVEFGRSEDLAFSFPPAKTSVITLKLKKKGAPYWSRPDLGIGRDDIRVEGNTVRVTVHSLGSVGTPGGTVRLVGRDGKTIASARIPKLAAPVDLIPKTAEVKLAIPAGANLEDAEVRIDCGKVKEITVRNNRVAVGK